MRAELQGTIVPVLEESLAVNAKNFFCFLDGNPVSGLGHGAE